MKFSKAEREIVKVMVQYENRGWNLASVLNHCRLLEKHGIGIVNADNADLVCLRKDLYPDYFTNRGKVYVNALLNLVEKLAKNGDLICDSNLNSQPLVIGVDHSAWINIDIIGTSEREIIVLDGPNKGWFGADGEEKYWMCDDWKHQLSRIDQYLYSDYCVSEELKDFVKNNFRTDEEMRFVKQQLITWISIGVSALLGILGIIF